MTASSVASRATAGEATRRINSSAKGKRAERHFAEWVSRNGWPNTTREIKTGTILKGDGGDVLVGKPPFLIVCELKHLATGLTETKIREFRDKLRGQVLQSGGWMGVLVERRNNVIDPGRWYVHVGAGDLAQVVKDFTWTHVSDASTYGVLDHVTVRLMVSEFFGMIRAAGNAAGHPDQADAWSRHLQAKLDRS